MPIDDYGEDQWTWAKPKSPLHLAHARMTTVKYMRKRHLLHIKAFTCDDCPRAPICVLAFDANSTDGDCAYDK